MNNKIAELSVLAVASKYGLLKQNQQGKPAKTKKQIKAREATKRQRKARKKHAYKSIFRDRAKVVKKKSVAVCANKRLSARSDYGGYPTIYKLATKKNANENKEGLWQQAYSQAVADSVDIAVSIDFDADSTLILMDNSKPNRLSVANVEKFINDEINKK